MTKLEQMQHKIKAHLSILDEKITNKQYETYLPHSYLLHRDDLNSLITEVWNEAIKEERERCGQCILCTQDIDGDTCDCCKQNWERIDDPDLPRANITSDKTTGL